MVQIQTGASKCTKMTGIANPGKTVSIIMRGSNKLMLEEADRYTFFSLYFEDILGVLVLHDHLTYLNIC